MSFDPTELLQDLDDAKLEALVETMYLAADADGEFTSDERTHLADAILRVAGDHETLAGDKLAELLEQAQNSLEAEGREARLALVKERLGDDAARRGALAMAISVTAADGILRTSEREFIFDLAAALGIEGDAAADLVRQVTRG